MRRVYSINDQKSGSDPILQLLCENVGALTDEQVEARWRSVVSEADRPSLDGVGRLLQRSPGRFHGYKGYRILYHQTKRQGQVVHEFVVTTRSQGFHDPKPLFTAHGSDPNTAWHSTLLCLQDLL